MLRLFVAGFGVALMSVVLLSGNNSVGAANAAADPGIEDIMKKLFKGGKSLHKTAGKALEAATPDWADVGPMAKTYAEQAAALPKNAVPKGDAKSWAKLTKQFADDAKSFDAAVAKKDKAASVAAWGKLNKSCTACHDEHR